MSPDRRTVRQILWDWNGTLLNDVDLCVHVLSHLCERRGLPRIPREQYLRTYTFPIIDYYRSVGFDFEREPFDVAAREWVALYVEGLPGGASLHEGAEEVLATLRDRGIGQGVLSAHKHDMLEADIRRFGLEEYLDPILGAGDYYGSSKVDVGVAWMQATHHGPDDVLLVGDTVHDWEVAEAMGIRCILVAQGHQARERLEETGAPVLDSIRAVPGYLGEA